MTLFVNLYAGPGAGKSATAYSVAGKLKAMGVNAELTPEFAKFLVWDERVNTLKNQIYTTAKQFYMMNALKDKADVVITDSPVLLGVVYSPDYPDSWHSTIKWCHEQVSTPGLDFFISRSTPFQPIGRAHTEEQSRKLDGNIRLLLLQEDIDVAYVELSTAVEVISHAITEKLHGSE